MAFYITFKKLLIYHNSNTQSWECHAMYLRVLYTPHTCCRRLCPVLGVLMGWSRLGVGRGESSGKNSFWQSLTLCRWTEKTRDKENQWRSRFESVSPIKVDTKHSTWAKFRVSREVLTLMRNPGNAGTENLLGGSSSVTPTKFQSPSSSLSMCVLFSSWISADACQPTPQCNTPSQEHHCSFLSLIVSLLPPGSSFTDEITIG